MRPNPTSRHARGFTLVEIMVALAIGTVIMLGVTTVFMSVLRSYTVQNGVSDTNDTGRYAMQYLARHIRMAGYRDSNWARGRLVDVMEFTNGASDSLTVTYESETGCNLAGGAVTAIDNVFDVVGGVLRCNGRRIIDGVDEMQVFLGEDTDADGVVNRYVDPGTAGVDLNNVLTISVNLLVRSDSNRVATGASPRAFGFWNTPAGADGRIRREYSMIVKVRNT